MSKEDVDTSNLDQVGEQWRQKLSKVKLPTWNSSNDEQVHESVNRNVDVTEDQRIKSPSSDTSNDHSVNRNVNQTEDQTIISSSSDTSNDHSVNRNVDGTEDQRIKLSSESSNDHTVNRNVDQTEGQTIISSSSDTSNDHSVNRNVDGTEDHRIKSSSSEPSNDYTVNRNVNGTQDQMVKSLSESSNDHSVNRNVDRTEDQRIKLSSESSNDHTVNRNVDQTEGQTIISSSSDTSNDHIVNRNVDGTEDQRIKLSSSEPSNIYTVNRNVNGTQDQMVKSSSESSNDHSVNRNVDRTEDQRIKLSTSETSSDYTVNRNIVIQTEDQRVKSSSSQPSYDHTANQIKLEITNNDNSASDIKQEVKTENDIAVAFSGDNQSNNNVINKEKTETKHEGTYGEFTTGNNVPNHNRESKHNPKVTNNSELENRPAVSSDQVESQNKPDVINDQVESQKNPDVINDQVESQHKPDVINDQGESQNKPDVIDDQVESQNKPDVINDQVESQNKSIVTDDQAESQNKPDVISGQTESQNKPDVIDDQVESQNKSDVTNDQVESQNKPDVTDDQVESQNKPAVIDDQVESQNKPDVIDDQAESQNKPDVIDDQVESQNKPDVIDDQVESQNKPAVIDDQVESQNKPDVIDDQAESQNKPDVIDDLVESQNKSVVTDDQVESQNKPDVTDDQAESQNKPAVIDDQVESQNKPDVIDDQAESQNKPDVIDDQVESQNKPDVIDDQVESQNKPDVIDDQVESQNKPDVIDDQVESQNKPDVIDDQAESQNKPDVIDDQVESQKKPDVIEDQTESQNKPDVTDDQVESQNKPDVISEQTDSQNKSDVTDDQVESQNNSDVTDDQAESQNKPDVINDQIEPKNKPDVISEQTDSQNTSDVTDDQVESQNKSDETDDHAESQNKSIVTDDQAESQNKSDVINDQAESQNKPDVINDQAESQDKPDVINDQAESQDKPDVISDQAESQDKLDVINDHVEIKGETFNDKKPAEFKIEHGIKGDNTESQNIPVVTIDLTETVDLIETSDLPETSDLAETLPEIRSSNDKLDTQPVIIKKNQPESNPSHHPNSKEAKIVKIIDKNIPEIGRKRDRCKSKTFSDLNQQDSLQILKNYVKKRRKLKSYDENEEADVYQKSPSSTCSDGIHECLDPKCPKKTNTNVTKGDNLFDHSQSMYSANHINMVEIPVSHYCTWSISPGLSHSGLSNLNEALDLSLPKSHALERRNENSDGENTEKGLRMKTRLRTSPGGDIRDMQDLYKDSLNSPPSLTTSRLKTFTSNHSVPRNVPELISSSSSKNSNVQVDYFKTKSKILPKMPELVHTPTEDSCINDGPRTYTRSAKVPQQPVYIYLGPGSVSSPVTPKPRLVNIAPKHQASHANQPTVRSGPYPVSSPVATIGSNILPTTKFGSNLNAAVNIGANSVPLATIGANILPAVRSDQVPPALSGSNPGTEAKYRPIASSRERSASTSSISWIGTPKVDWNGGKDFRLNKPTEKFHPVIKGQGRQISIFLICNTCMSEGKAMLPFVNGFMLANHACKFHHAMPNITGPQFHFTMNTSMANYHCIPVVQEKIFPCKYGNCLRKFTSMRLLKNHIAEYHAKDIKLYLFKKCQYRNCERIFPTHDLRKQHVKDFHLEHRIQAEDTYGALWLVKITLNKESPGDPYNQGRLELNHEEAFGELRNFFSRSYILQRFQLNSADYFSSFYESCDYDNLKGKSFDKNLYEKLESFEREISIPNLCQEIKNSGGDFVIDVNNVKSRMLDGGIIIHNEESGNCVYIDDGLSKGDNPPCSKQDDVDDISPVSSPLATETDTNLPDQDIVENIKPKDVEMDVGDLVFLYGKPDPNYVPISHDNIENEESAISVKTETQDNNDDNVIVENDDGGALTIDLGKTEADEEGETHTELEIKTQDESSGGTNGSPVKYESYWGVIGNETMNNSSSMCKTEHLLSNMETNDDIIEIDIGRDASSIVKEEKVEKSPVTKPEKERKDLNARKEDDVGHCISIPDSHVDVDDLLKSFTGNIHDDEAAALLNNDISKTTDKPKKRRKKKVLKDIERNKESVDSDDDIIELDLQLDESNSAVPNGSSKDSVLGTQDSAILLDRSVNIKTDSSKYMPVQPSKNDKANRSNSIAKSVIDKVKNSHSSKDPGNLKEIGFHNKSGGEDFVDKSKQLTKVPPTKTSVGGSNDLKYKQSSVVRDGSGLKSTTTNKKVNDTSLMGLQQGNKIMDKTTLNGVKKVVLTSGEKCNLDKTESNRSKMFTSGKKCNLDKTVSNGGKTYGKSNLVDELTMDSLKDRWKMNSLGTYKIPKTTNTNGTMKGDNHVLKEGVSDKWTTNWSSDKSVNSEHKSSMPKTPYFSSARPWNIEKLKKLKFFDKRPGKQIIKSPVSNCILPSGNRKTSLHSTPESHSSDKETVDNNGDRNAHNNSSELIIMSDESQKVEENILPVSDNEDKSRNDLPTQSLDGVTFEDYGCQIKPCGVKMFKLDDSDISYICDKLKSGYNTDYANYLFTMHRKDAQYYDQLVHGGTNISQKPWKRKRILKVCKDMFEIKKYLSDNPNKHCHGRNRRKNNKMAVKRRKHVDDYEWIVNSDSDSDTISLDNSSYESEFSEGEENYFVCPEPDCDKRFHSSAALEKHMIRTHVDEDYLERKLCPVIDCERSYSNKYNLLSHIKKDHGEDVYNKIKEELYGADPRTPEPVVRPAGTCLMPTVWRTPKPLIPPHVTAPAPSQPPKNVKEVEDIKNILSDMTQSGNRSFYSILSNK